MRRASCAEQTFFFTESRQKKSDRLKPITHLLTPMQEVSIARRTGASSALILDIGPRQRFYAMSPKINSFLIQAVKSELDQNRFLAVPRQVYAQDKHWVEPLRSDIAKLFATDNPFLNYGRFQAWVALRNQQPVGRIVAAINDRLVEREGVPIGVFGYFECVDEDAIAQSLLTTACDWLQQQGMVRARGPINLSTHNNCLMLVEGFDQPLFMMPYNPPYYPQFMEQGGWTQAKDAYAYDLPLNQPLPDSYEKAYRIALKSGIEFRPLRIKGEGFETDCRNLYQLFTKAFANNWSSTPRSEEEFLEEARGLKSVVDPNIFPIAEYQGEMVGFFMSIPDYNVALKPVGGKLNLPGLLKFLWYRRQISEARVIVICALPEQRRKMVAPALIYLGHRNGTHGTRTYQRAELSWVYEDNWPSRKIIEATGAKHYKTYRIFEKTL
jgi:hypothetical protein